MTTRYVGIGGNNSNDGLSWANRKLTLNGAEDTPVVAGDTVYVGPGTYRELLTVDVAGTAGNPITYIGDYTGANTDGIGGVVRITGSDNDQTNTRNNCISCAQNYRTFRGFQMDMTVQSVILLSNCTNAIIEKCKFINTGSFAVTMNGASQSTHTIRNCAFWGNISAASFTHTSTVDNAGHAIENCIVLGGNQSESIQSTRVGGITCRNILINAVNRGFRIQTALTVGQTMTVNNCIIQHCLEGFRGTVTGEIVEDYNSLYGNSTARVNTATGANSLTYPPLFDTRWFFQITHEGAGPYSPLQMVSPFDLSSQSRIINVTGTNPAPTDMRGTAIQNTQREWGVLEYDSTLSIKARQSGMVDGGMIIS